jgi:Glycosyl transferase family 21
MEVIPATLALFFALSSLALTLLFAARLRIVDERPNARVTLVLPLTGLNPNLEELFDALAAQSLPPRKVIVAVESPDDPAHGRIKAFGGQYREIAIELVVAGLSSLRSQKCTNLLMAVAELDDAPYLVFFDADIRPQPWWLAALVGPLTAGRADIVNGYRWPAPKTISMARSIFAGIDRAIAILPRLSFTKAIWGGSLAMTRHALETLDLPQTIGRTLTEDLPIGARAAEIGLRVLTRRALRAPTPLDGRVQDLWRFGRRQYQLIHIYRPGLWLYAAVVVTTDFAARITLLVMLIMRGASGITVAVLIAIAALGSVTVELRSTIGRKLGVRDRLGMRLWQHFLTWMIVPLPAVHASVIWGGLITSPVRWAHIRYIVDRRGQVTDIVRQPYSDQSA